MGMDRSLQFTFSQIPTDANALMGLPEADLSTPYKTAALAMLALLKYEESPESCSSMPTAVRKTEYTVII